MEDLKKNQNSEKLQAPEKQEEELDDLDRFIEKRKLQNEALKKIVGLGAHAPEAKKIEKD